MEAGALQLAGEGLDTLNALAVVGLNSKRVSTLSLGAGEIVVH